MVKIKIILLFKIWVQNKFLIFVQKNNGMQGVNKKTNNTQHDIYNYSHKMK